MNNLTDKLEEIRKAFDFIKMKVAQAPTGSNDRFFTDIDKWANHGLQEVDALSKHSDPEVSEEEIERLRSEWVINHMDLSLDYPGAPAAPKMVAFAKWLRDRGLLSPKGKQPMKGIVLEGPEITEGEVIAMLKDGSRPLIVSRPKEQSKGELTYVMSKDYEKLYEHLRKGGKAFCEVQKAKGVRVVAKVDIFNKGIYIGTDDREYGGVDNCAEELHVASVRNAFRSECHRLNLQYVALSSGEHICPTTKEVCRDECCRQDSSCNLSGKGEQPQQEPVAWMNKDGSVLKETHKEYTIPLYRSPQAPHNSGSWISVDELKDRMGHHRASSFPEGAILAWRRKRKPHHNWEHGIYTESDDKARDQFNIKGREVKLIEWPQQ